MGPKRRAGRKSIYPATCFRQPSRRREPRGPEADLGQPQGPALRREPGGSRIWLSAFSQEDSIDRLRAVGPLLSGVTQLPLCASSRLTGQGPLTVQGSSRLWVPTPLPAEMHLWKLFKPLFTWRVIEKTSLLFKFLRHLTFCKKHFLIRWFLHSSH